MAPDGVLLAVDPFSPGRPGFRIRRLIARREVAKVRTGVLVWVRLSGNHARRAHREAGHVRIDFIFIDGDHSYEAFRDDWDRLEPARGSKWVVARLESRSTPDRIGKAGSALFTQKVILKDGNFGLVEQVDSLTIVHRP
jgi:hypothetical protein